jgi:hypothetical protein
LPGWCRDGHRGQHRDRDGLEFDDQDAEYKAAGSADTHIPYSVDTHFIILNGRSAD